MKILLEVCWFYFLWDRRSRGRKHFTNDTSGLAVEEPGKIKVLVENPGEEGKTWGLTEQSIRTAIAGKLQSANIVPLPEKNFSLPYWLLLWKFSYWIRHFRSG